MSTTIGALQTLARGIALGKNKNKKTSADFSKYPKITPSKPLPKPKLPKHETPHKWDDEGYRRGQEPK